MKVWTASIMAEVSLFAMCNGVGAWLMDKVIQAGYDLTVAI